MLWFHAMVLILALNSLLNIIDSESFTLLYLSIVSLLMCWLVCKVSLNQHPNHDSDGNSVCREKRNCRDPKESTLIPLGQGSVVVFWRFPAGI